MTNQPEYPPIPEATLTETPDGLVPEGEGWFVLNVADAPAMVTEKFGSAVTFEPRLFSLFDRFGVNVTVLEPGKPSTIYHREALPEAFLVLSGEVIAIVEGEERRLKKGDFLYSPPGTAHALVGAGDGPSSVLMLGARSPEGNPAFYPADATAAKHGASASEDTDDTSVAYADFGGIERKRIDVPW